MQKIGRQDVMIKLTIIFSPQPEGGFTITCRELPELITECDSIDEIRAKVLND